MEGFFAATELTVHRDPPSLIAKCGHCGLYKHCKTPKMEVSGQGRRKILIIGEAPGETEDERGKPFIGRAGKRLREALERCDVIPDEDCWITNAIICHPKHNATPTDSQIEDCLPNLIQTVKTLQPEIIIPLGAAAVKALLGWVWGPQAKNKAIGLWTGWRIPCRKLNAWICPANHPSYVLRTENDQNGPVVAMMFDKQIKGACILSGRPYKKDPPDLSKMITVMTEINLVPKRIKEFIDAGEPIAFDFETDRIKPDSKESKIATMAISNGRDTIAYPWRGLVVASSKELLASHRVPKIGFNIKFEDRWGRRHGIEINNWMWCGMTDAHVLDNRPGICSLEFQAFVVLGVDPWDEGIYQYLRSRESGGNEPNTVFKAPLKKLLLYNGIDALLEYRLCFKQMAKMGVVNWRDLPWLSTSTEDGNSLQTPLKNSTGPPGRRT